MKNFKLIDIEKWDRKELYLHYTKNVPFLFFKRRT